MIVHVLSICGKIVAIKHSNLTLCKIYLLSISVGGEMSARGGRRVKIVSLPSIAVDLTCESVDDVEIRGYGLLWTFTTVIS